jgi:hypothetical protein
LKRLELAAQYHQIIPVHERECCLLVLNLVSSTLPCIRQPRPRLSDMSLSHESPYSSRIVATAESPLGYRTSFHGGSCDFPTVDISAKINRRVPDKTHTRQPAPALCGVRTGANGRHLPDPPHRWQVAPISARAHAPQRSTAPRAHPPPWASSPGRFRASPASSGDGSDAWVVWRRSSSSQFRTVGKKNSPNCPTDPTNFGLVFRSPQTLYLLLSPKS